MNRLDTFDVVWSSYRRSLNVIIVAAIVAAFLKSASDVVIIDFLAQNPHRSRQHAIGLPIFFAAISAPFIFFGVWLVFGPAQWLLAQVMASTAGTPWRKTGTTALALPCAAVLSWYCYDCMVPSDLQLGINAGPEWEPYRHGITWRRYVTTLSVQSVISAFSLYRVWGSDHDSG